MVVSLKWIPLDAETYLGAKEYVDTAVIPLYSITFEDELKESAIIAEFLTLLTRHLERQFTGRIFLIPPFVYLKDQHKEKTFKDLKSWEEVIGKSGFKHIFYITSESDWKQYEKSLDGSLVWIPSVPLENMNDVQKMSIIDSQIRQLFHLLTEKWSEK